MVFLARVRGIYATALAALLMKRGFILSDLSRVLKSRIDAPVAEKPPHVTVKSSDDSMDEIVVLGYPWDAGEEAEKAILHEVKYASVRRGKLGLHSVVDAKSLGDCMAELPGGLKAKIDVGECPSNNSMFRATVVKEALKSGEYVVVKPIVELVGLTVRVKVPGSGVSFSRFIRDELKADILSTLNGAGVDLSRVHVRVRSGASLAEPSEVASEAARLASEAEALASEPPSSEPRLVKRGEFISIIHLPSIAKRVMDELRRRLYPTVNRHHEIKSWGGDVESAIVDYAEEGLKRGLWGPEAGDVAAEFIASKLVEANRVFIKHYTPHGKTLNLGPFTVKSVSRGSSLGDVSIMLERVFRSYGVLDALEVEKRPGDKGVTKIDTSKWFIIHEYYTAAGELLGIYANINTPPEVGSKAIKYLDLLVDVVKKPGETPEIVDLDQLEEAYKDGLITKELYETAINEAEKTARRLKSIYP